MEFVHGTFNSFKDMGAAMGLKAPKGKPEQAMECSYCGQSMHRIGDTNVWACGRPYIVDTTLKGKPVQVFGSSCPQITIGEA